MKQKAIKPNTIIIGITMGLDEHDLIRQGVDYSFIRREYGEIIRRVGGEPIFLDPSIDPRVAVELCDGIVISGGDDIEPDIYGEADRSGQQKEPRLRTDWERQLIDACDENGRSILGICYGAQLLNVHYGGSLYQDINQETGSEYSHGTSDAAAIHTITFRREFMGYELGDRVQATSRHHQAVKRLAPGFVAAASAPDGVTEAIISQDHYGVQWHAEADETAERLYGAFLERCRHKKAARARADRADRLVVPPRQFSL